MEGVRRIGDFAQRLADAKAATPELEKIADDAEGEMLAALYDDLNAPIALGALFTFLSLVNGASLFAPDTLWRCRNRDACGLFGTSDPTPTTTFGTS